MSVLQVDKNKLINTINHVDEVCNSYNQNMKLIETCIQDTLSASWDGDDKVAFTNKFFEQFGTSSDAYKYVKLLVKYKNKLEYAKNQYEITQRQALEEAESLTDLLSYLG